MSNKRKNPDDDNGASRKRSATVGEIQPLDVILGRESLSAWQLGSINLVKSIDERLDEYTNSASNQAKSQIIQEVYAAAKAGGRFLTRDEEGGGYVFLDEHDAKEKISHMIRYRRKRKRCMMKATKAKPKAAPPNAATHSNAGVSSSFDHDGVGGGTSATSVSSQAFSTTETTASSSQTISPFWGFSSGGFIPIHATDGASNQAFHDLSHALSFPPTQERGEGSNPALSPYNITRPSSDIDPRSSPSSDQDYALFSNAELRSVLSGIFYFSESDSSS